MIQVRRIGHITLQSPDIDRQADYFPSVVGLVEAAREKDRVFLASKLGPLSAQLERGDVARCARLSFEVAPDTDFAAAEKFLAGEGIKSERRNDPNPGVRTMLTFTDPNGVAIDLFPEWTPLGLDQEARGIGVLKLGHVAQWSTIRASSWNSIAAFSASASPTGSRTGSCSCAAGRITTRSTSSPASSPRCITWPSS